MKARLTRSRARVVIHETAASYADAPMQEFIQAEITKKTWIYRIIEGEKEAEQVIFKNDEFIILPDSEGVDEVGVLNWMLIFKDTKLMSMRDLRGIHIPMLKSINDTVAALLPPEFNSPMLYFHYVPSVWQSHLHIACPCDMLRTTNSMQRVYFLQDVISNLLIDPDYYTKATLTYILPSSHELAQLHTRWMRSWTGEITCNDQPGADAKVCGRVRGVGSRVETCHVPATIPL
jgi:m7GpppX diphosphatase